MRGANQRWGDVLGNHGRGQVVEKSQAGQLRQRQGKVGTDEEGRLEVRMWGRNKNGGLGGGVGWGERIRLIAKHVIANYLIVKYVLP